MDLVNSIDWGEYSKLEYETWLLFRRLTRDPESQIFYSQSMVFNRIVHEDEYSEIFSIQRVRDVRSWDLVIYPEI